MMRPFLDDDAALKAQFSWFFRIYMRDFFFVFNFFKEMKSNWSLSVDKSYRIVVLFVFVGISFHRSNWKMLLCARPKKKNVFLAHGLDKLRHCIYILAFTPRSRASKLFYPPWPYAKQHFKQRRWIQVRRSLKISKSRRNGIQYARASKLLQQKNLKFPPFHDDWLCLIAKLEMENVV